jgi:hypothetical protein
MQKQLNDCIRHHQQIIRCVSKTFIKHKRLRFARSETGVFLHNLLHFQIHGSTGRHNKYCTVWSISDHAIYNVFCCLLGHHGKIPLTHNWVEVTTCTISFWLQYIRICHTKYSYDALLLLRIERKC